MQTITTRRGSGKKPFAWSFSKLKNFEACPKRHYHVDLLKQHKDDSPALTWGVKVHEMMASHIEKGAPLDDEIQRHWAQQIFTFKGKDVRDAGAHVQVEQKLAFNADFQPCAYFAPDAWYRAKADVVWLLGPLGVAVDWKTGRIEEESPQLALTAAALFYHHPHLQVVRSEYIWLKEDAATVLDIKRDELPKLWSNLWPRIEALRVAHETDDYPPNPCRLCEKWCPVKQCPYNGTRQV